MSVLRVFCFIVSQARYSHIRSFPIHTTITTSTMASSTSTRRTFTTSSGVVPPLLSSSTTTGLYSSTTNSDTKYLKPPRLIVSDTDLPTLYVYDHCPFCVRVRAAFGLKNIKYNLFFLPNDDSITPTKLVGKKISPIFEWTTSNICMPESMDIIKLVDSDEQYGPINMILPESGRSDLKAWQGEVRDLLRGLQRPRYVATGLLPEFQQYDSRVAFIKNHELVGYTKDEWKKSNTISIEEKIQLYTTALQKDPMLDIQELNQKLIELDQMIYCEHYVTDMSDTASSTLSSRNEYSNNYISIDDIDLFARLRSITIIKNVIWPTKLRNYMNYMSEITDIALYDAMAM
jgi:glutaredoxin 2